MKYLLLFFGLWLSVGTLQAQGNCTTQKVKTLRITPRKTYVFYRNQVVCGVAAKRLRRSRAVLRRLNDGKHCTRCTEPEKHGCKDVSAPKK